MLHHSKLFLTFLLLLYVERHLTRIHLEAGSKKELAVANSAAAAKLTGALNLTQRHVLALFSVSLVLLCEHAKFVGTLFACFMATKFTYMPMLGFELLIADVTVGLIEE